MEQRNKEYDTFGPWIHEINSEEDVPRIFKGFYNGWDHYLLLFKVPCIIDRRDAHPGMDLYDYLIGAYEGCLRILTRIGWNVIEQRIDYQDIMAVRDVHALLKGELILYTPLGPVVIRYNTVSEEIICKLIHIIMGKIDEGMRRVQIQSMPIFYRPGGFGSLDMLFYNLISTLQKDDPDLVLAAYQHSMHVKKTGGFVQRLYNEAVALSQTAFIIRGNEMIVLERRISAKKADAYEYSYLHVPLQNITWTRLSSIYYEQHLSCMELVIKNIRFNYIFDDRNITIFNLHNALSQMNNNA